MPAKYPYGTYKLPDYYKYQTKDELSFPVTNIRYGMREEPFPSHKIPLAQVNKLQVYKDKLTNKVEGYYQDRHPELCIRKDFQLY